MRPRHCRRRAPCRSACACRSRSTMPPPRPAIARSCSIPDPQRIHTMAILVCGSLAFDTIMTFEGRFADQILPDQLHILNVSFLVPGLRRDFGGCAGNIAYGLHQLGSKAVPLAALGSDGADYLERMRSLGVDTSHVVTVAEAYTAQAMIMTDRDNNQITAFHPGAM